MHKVKGGLVWSSDDHNKEETRSIPIHRIIWLEVEHRTLHAAYAFLEFYTLETIIILATGTSPMHVITQTILGH